MSFSTTNCVSRSKLICALLALVFTFESANADWDDDVINFVDNDVPILTKAYAENDLRKRWTDTFLAPTAQAGALQTDIVRRVQSLEFHNVGDKVDTPTAIRLLKSLDAALASLRFDQSRLEKTIFQIDSLIGACECMEVLPYKRLGRSLSLMSLCHFLTLRPFLLFGLTHMVFLPFSQLCTAIIRGLKIIEKKREHDGR